MSRSHLDDSNTSLRQLVNGLDSGMAVRDSTRIEHVEQRMLSVMSSMVSSVASMTLDEFREMYGVTKSTKQPCKSCFADKGCRYLGKGYAGHK